MRLGGSSSFRGPYFRGLQLGIPIVGFSYGDRCYWLPRVVNRRQRRSAELLTFSRLECPLTTRSRIPAGAEIHVRFNQRLAGPVFPSIFRPPVFDARNQDLSAEFFHGAVSCAARLVTCKSPICVRGACHHPAPPKARVDHGQSGTSQDRSRRCHAVGLSGQASSIARPLLYSLLPRRIHVVQPA